MQKPWRGSHRKENEEQNGTKVALAYIKERTYIITRILK